MWLIALARATTWSGGDVVDHAVGGGAPYAVGVGDLDGDGVLDPSWIATDPATWSDGERPFLLGATLSTLGGDRERAAPGASLASFVLRVADLDGDGTAELLTVGETGIALLRSSGALGLVYAGVLEESDAVVADVGDLDGDGRPDVAALRADGRVTTWRNAGGLVFDAPRTVAAIGDVRTRLALADLDGDGAAEVILGAGDGLYVMMNDGDGRLDTGVRTAAVDLEVDGLGPAGLVGVRSGGLATLSEDPDGTLRVEVVAPGAATASVTRADLDGDGVADLVAAEQGGQAVEAWLARDGVYVGPTVVALPADRYAGADGEPIVAAADLDGDGCGDVVVAQLLRGVVTVYGACAAETTVDDGADPPGDDDTGEPTTTDDDDDAHEDDGADPTSPGARDADGCATASARSPASRPLAAGVTLIAALIARRRRGREPATGEGVARGGAGRP